ncbi:hypothetical protein [Kocuria nitroreducens]|uniref:hypothetical protein n=1 Tax=Kocuria nitroreducens TaxID=3058914 RepID=UPI0036D8C8E2
MNTTQRITAAAAAVLLRAATPAGATSHEPAPPDEMQELLPSTHGKFVPYPDEAKQPFTTAACDSEVTLATGDVDEREYRVLIDTEGNTVVESRGETTLDITRASDGATLDEVSVDGRSFQTNAADGTSLTVSGSGPGVVFPYSEAEAQAFAEAGLPEAFLFLSGELTGTITLEPASEPGQEPTVVSAEITENSTEYVFDLCDLLDQAAAEQ